MVQVWRNLVLNKVAEVVAEKEKGGKWKFKSPKQQADILKRILQKLI
jgi:hypothetical protein